MKKKKRINSPYLKNKEIRVRFGSRLPDAVKEGLRDIAKSENKSMSYVVEEVIIDYFGLTRPKYLIRKNRSKDGRKS